eukprot:TRINITY_DN46512_c0_g1_i1.p1 TRINITY_DN46512_c0_g1~~TRINITY_DN46512_c0_g1_i1.p1  ORF type:complete len:1127 (+),score=95.15 TRINITY_DN46512_c0_g1_i1:117-3497(+)
MNFMMFAMETEAMLDVSERAMSKSFSQRVITLSWWLQLCSIAFFIAMLWGRACAARLHPQWRTYGTAAPKAYLLKDKCALVDMLSVLPSCIHMTGLVGRCPNLMWLGIVRSVDIMTQQPSTGLAIRKLRSLLHDDGPLLMLVYVFGAVLWILFSGLFFLANCTNSASTWSAAEFKGEPWQRFESIPSSMFFVLISLSKEEPLASVFQSCFSRVLVVIVCIFGVPLFAIPAGIIGCVLQRSASSTEASELELSRGGGAARERAVNPGPRASSLDLSARRVYWHVVTAVVGFGSALTFFFYTAGPTVFLFFPLHISASVVAVVDGVAAVIFCVEWTVRAFYGGYSYLTSSMGIVDLLSWPMGIAHAALWVSGVSIGDWLRAACVLRVLKLERYVRAFHDAIDIVTAELPLAKASSFVIFLMWIVFSTLLYFTERDNRDPDIRENYGSVARSLWAEVINLHGEWVWCDFSSLGKAVCVFISVFSTSICIVPVAIFTSGFESRIHARLSTIEDVDIARWEAARRPQGCCRKRDVYDACYAHLHVAVHKGRPFQVLRVASVLVTLLSACLTAWVTVSYQAATGCIILDCCASLFMLLEFSLRLYALGWIYLSSIVGVCDVMSLLAFVVSLTSMRPVALQLAVNQRVVCLLIPLRLLRLITLETYLPAIHILISVMRINRKWFSKSGYALIAIWYIYGTLLYLFERGGEGAMAVRYHDVLSGLQFALVHLTGDVPIYEYTLPSKAVHVLGFALGMGCTAAFTGIFTAGFVDYLKRQRRVERRHVNESRLRNAFRLVVLVVTLQRRFRQRQRQRAVAGRWTQIRAVIGLGAARDHRQSGRSFPSLRELARRIVRAETAFGKRVMWVAHAALALNLIKTIVSTVPETQSSPIIVALCDTAEVATGMVFLVEYVLRLVAARPVWRTLLKPPRIIDFFCLLPTFCRLGLVGEVYGHHHWSRDGSRVDVWQRAVDCALIFRVLRVFQFPIVSKVTKRAWRAFTLVVAGLSVPGILALQVWFITASLFMVVEYIYDGDSWTDMATLPDALYWTSIYLVGEWANVDFSPGAGSRLCIFTCLIGVAIFAMPIGLVVEVVKNIFEDAAAARQTHREYLRIAAQRREKMAEARRIRDGVSKS